MRETPMCANRKICYRDTESHFNTRRNSSGVCSCRSGMTPAYICMDFFCKTNKKGKNTYVHFIQENVHPQRRNPLTTYHILCCCHLTSLLLCAFSCQVHFPQQHRLCLTIHKSLGVHTGDSLNSKG